VDSDPPVLSLKVEKGPFEGKYKFVSPSFQFILSAEDEKSGVDKIKYSLNSSLIETTYSEPFTLEKKGLHYIRAQASDFVGNKSTPLVRAFYCDIEPPKSDITIGSPKFSSRDTIFVSSNTSFSLKASDSDAGIQSIHFRINDADKKTYTTPFQLDKKGVNIIYYGAIDNVNNTEKEKNLEVYVDTEPPDIHYHFSVQSIGSKTVRDEQYTIYPTNAMLYIAATDNRSGGEKIEYRLNGGSLKTENPITSLPPDNYLVEVSVYDVLGNKNTTEIKFAIEE
jgi:hypothetical protein